MLKRRELRPSDVRGLVFEAMLLLAETQKKTNLSICPNLEKTYRILKNGQFKSLHLPKKRDGIYQMEFGAYEPPATIIMDSRIPFVDRPLNIPEIPHTLLRYIAIHEVIHVDDHLGGDHLFNGTKKHILKDHDDKLVKGMAFIENNGHCDQIKSKVDLASIWSSQYADMVSHFKTFVTLRSNNFPKLYYIWSKMQEGSFPPRTLEEIEREKGIRYIFRCISYVGKYCLIDAVMESSNIGEKTTCKYIV